MRLSGRAVNKLPVVAPQRAAQLWRYGAKVKTVLALTIGTLATCAASAADVSVRQVQQNLYEFVLTNRSTLSEKDAQTIIAISASSICKDLAPLPGKYRFDAKEKIGAGSAPGEPDAFRFVQEVSCASRTRVDIGERRPTLHTAEESRRVQQEVRNMSEAYLRLIAKGQVDKAFARMSASTMGVNQATWKGEKLSFRATAGEPIRISIVKITIYDNPTEAPEPGLYVAADFGNEFKNVPTHCGYLMWFRPVGGAFRITREENGFVTTEQLKAIPSTQLPEIKQRLHCVAP